MIYKALLYKELLQWYYNNGVVNSFTILDAGVGKVPEELNFDFVHLGHTGKVKVVKADGPNKLSPGTTVKF